MERPGTTDVEGPNESAPGHEIPEPPAESPEPQRQADPDAPNESAPGHEPEPPERP